MSSILDTLTQSLLLKVRCRTIIDFTMKTIRTYTAAGTYRRCQQQSENSWFGHAAGNVVEGF